jgi:hypothetical protein
MIKTLPTKYNEQDARTRFNQVLNDALGAPRKPLPVTATLKRRALKKKRDKSSKKAGTGGAIPAVLFLLLCDRNECSDS